MKQEFELELPELVHFVKESCHENLYQTLCEIEEIADDEHFPKMLRQFIQTFTGYLKNHLQFEEKHLFPQLKGNGSVHTLLSQHDKIRSDLLKLRQMTNNYERLTHDDLNKNLLYEELREMDRVVLNHIQIQNNILFPMILH